MSQAATSFAQTKTKMRGHFSLQNVTIAVYIAQQGTANSDFHK